MALMPSLKLHIKTALLASAVALVLLIISFLVISANIASQIQGEQKELAILQAENLAENLSLSPEQINPTDLQQLTNLVSGSRPNLVTVRVWKLENTEFTEQSTADDSLPSEKIPAETQDALRSGRSSQLVNAQPAEAGDSRFRIFAPIVIKNKVEGAVEVVEKLDTVSTIAFQIITNLIWIALATIILMTAAFYLLFQNLVYLPLEKLLSAMEKAKTGNLSAEIADEIKQDEFGQFSGNFNSMMSQIREMTSERERRNEILQKK